jgi:hypothetical protein
MSAFFSLGKAEREEKQLPADAVPIRKLCAWYYYAATNYSFAIPIWSVAIQVGRLRLERSRRVQSLGNGSFYRWVSRYDRSDSQYGCYIPAALGFWLGPCVTTFGFWIPSQTEDLYRSIPNGVSLNDLIYQHRLYVFSFLSMPLPDDFR